MSLGLFLIPQNTCCYKDYRICKHLDDTKYIIKNKKGEVVAVEGYLSDDDKYANLPLIQDYIEEHPEVDEKELKAYLTCAAYPDGIPQEIINKKIKHFKPYKQDNDIVYEPGDEYEVNEYTWNKPKYTRYNFRVPQSILDKEAKEKAEKEAKAKEEKNKLQETKNEK